MLRVKNEGEFLEACVLSIVDMVDRIAIIDNLSTDHTPAIIRRLVAAHPQKVKAFRYEYPVGRVGQENLNLMAESNHKSPSLLSSFYNYCLSCCHTNFVLKWDGDMIATEHMAEELEKFRRARAMILAFRGANLHPNREALIGSVRSGQGPFNVLDNWTDSWTDHEPRVFPRLMARYDTGFSWCERLSSPFFAAQYLHQVEEPVYAHLKYCKGDPYLNMSPEFAAEVRQRLTVGPPLSPDLSRCLDRWRLGVAPVSHVSQLSN
jgi:hypothetical protein